MEYIEEQFVSPDILGNTRWNLGNNAPTLIVGVLQTQFFIYCQVSLGLLFFFDCRRANGVQIDWGNLGFVVFQAFNRDKNQVNLAAKNDC